MKIVGLKRKLAVGLVGLSLLGTTSIAFASSNAGAQFSAWAETQISAAKNAISTALGTSITNALPGVNSLATAKTDSAVAAIEDVAAAENSLTSAAVDAKLQAQITSLQNALADYRAVIGFEAMVTELNLNTTATLDQQLASLTQQVNNTINAAKSEKVDEVNGHSLTAKNEAREALLTAINETKTSLTNLVNAQKTQAESELSNHLANEVNRLNTTLDSLILSLQATAVASIQNASQSVETSAVANLDRVVGVIGTQTPIVVDNQTLQFDLKESSPEGLKWVVKNSNQFDVVFKWKLTGVDNINGISETPYKQANANFGETIFYTPWQGTTMVIEWKNHNGVWQQTSKPVPSKVK